MKSKRKGIILAGGNASRLYPLTNSISKQLMPIYDKPMIYYPLSTLLLSGLRDILIITNSRDELAFKNLLGDGSHIGINIEYAIQPFPGGLAQAFLIGEDFIGNDSVALILGDNLFHGNQLRNQLDIAQFQEQGATIFAQRVRNPSRYGVVELDSEGRVLSIEEKPTKPKSNYALTGLYFFDNTVIKRAHKLKPSPRGELEITDIIDSYLNTGDLKIQILGRGLAWLDTGTFDSLNAAGSYIRTLQNRQGMKIGCPEEIAWELNLINNKQLEYLAKKYLNSGYGEYLLNLLFEKENENIKLDKKNVDIN